MNSDSGTEHTRRAVKVWDGDIKYVDEIDPRKEAKARDARRL
ncbi:MAG: hypothetical protein WBQ74_11245 [Candidatus Sulfotelmatobacter sp.]